jgi:hypothetical protein
VMSPHQLGNLITVPCCGSCSTGRTDATLIGRGNVRGECNAPNTVLAKDASKR